VLVAVEQVGYALVAGAHELRVGLTRSLESACERVLARPRMVDPLFGSRQYRVGGAPIQHGALGRRVRRCGSVRTELIQGRPYELFDLSGVPPGVT
jgi:hypothetical protein